jgi:glucan-binding YG repeat protein
MKEKQPKATKEKKTKEPEVIEEKETKTKKAKKEKEPKAPKEKKVKPQKTPKVKQPKQIKNREKWTKKYFKKFSGRSQDSYELMLLEDYQNAIDRALKLLNITDSDYEKPVIITIPDAFGSKDRVTYRIDKKPDGSFTRLFDQALLNILFFGDEAFYYYQVNVDHRNGQFAYDQAGEFSYFDVVHLETKLSYDNHEKPKFITLDLHIGLSDGNKISLHLRNHRIHEHYDLPELLTKEEEEIISTLKQKVRMSRQV